MKANMVESLNNALDLVMSMDDTAVVLGEDVGTEGGVFRVTSNLKRKYGKRVIDTPLAESTIIGMSVGMALGGLHPFPEIQFSGFSYLAFDQIIAHAARYRSRTRGQFYLPIVVRAPMGGGVRALELHSENPEAFYAHGQGLVVIVPGGPYDAKGLLISASKLKDPVIFLEPLKLYRLFREEVPEEPYEVPVGKARVLREGSDVTVVTYGPTIPDTLSAVEKGKFNAEVIDLRTIHPMDRETVLKSIQKTGRLVVVHQAPESFGVGAEVSATVAEKGIYYLEGPIVRVASPSIPYPFPGYEDFYIPNPERISRGIRRALEG